MKVQVPVKRVDAVAERCRDIGVGQRHRGRRLAAVEILVEQQGLEDLQLVARMRERAGQRMPHAGTVRVPDLADVARGAALDAQPSPHWRREGLAASW